MPGTATLNSPFDLILFGAVGDLACRKLLPALYHLEKANLLTAGSRIIACGYDQLILAQYLELLAAKLKNFIPAALEQEIWQRLQARISYCSIDISIPHEFLRLKDIVNPKDRVIISYFAIPPSLYAQACKGLSQAGLTASPARVVLEKPLGEDLGSSIAINNAVAEFFSEEQIYRIDHYLGKETVINLLVLRFANAIFSANWDHHSIEKIEILIAEELGVEGRWNYYDKAGQLRDMVQNHLLQILSLITMEPPVSLTADSIRTEKLKALTSLRLINESSVQNYTVRGQYSRSVEGAGLPGYLEEPGANLTSQTETFVAIKTYIDNERWSGVPCYLITGKRLAKKQSEIIIHFKPQAQNLFQSIDSPLPGNQLIIKLQPDEGIGLNILNKTSGLDTRIKLDACELSLNFNALFKTERVVDAYERLLLEVMLGHQYLFVSRTEIEQAWRWIDSIKKAWDSMQTPLFNYPSGSQGPDALRRLFEDETCLS